MSWSSGLLDGKGVDGNGAQAPAPLMGRRLRVADYLEAPFHHPWWTLLPFLLTVGAATAAAFLMPEVYRSSCLVLIKASRVPEKIIANVADELDARRHQTIRQEILSRTRLEKVNDELHPYPDAATVGEAVEKLGRATVVEFKGSDAFSIQFSHRDPRMAQNVTSRLASLFIEEFRRSRRSEVEGAADFLDVELQEARTELDKKEEALRRYKEAHMGRLPEQLQANLSTLQRLQLELQGVDQNLEAAEARLERLTSRRGTSESPVAAPGTGLPERETLEAELARLRERYTEEHPEVRALVARLKAMESPPGTSAPPQDSGAMLSAQVDRARADVDTLLAHRDKVRGQMAALQASVEQVPRTEQELSVLNRDFTQLRENYQALLRKKMDAQTAERLQQRWTEDFEILDPARLPEHHVFPNRPLFIVAGIVVGLGLGLGAALLAELFSTYVISADDVESAVAVPVLAILPTVEPREVALARRYLAAKRSRRPHPPPAGRRANS